MRAAKRITSIWSTVLRRNFPIGVSRKLIGKVLPSQDARPFNAVLLRWSWRRSSTSDVLPAFGDWTTRRLRRERVVRGAVPISRRSQRYGAFSAGLPRLGRNRLAPTVLQRALSTR